ncbi:inositol monophosphatase, partial [bacterium M00.F.Ca.ET.156.01.1.1]
YEPLTLGKVAKGAAEFLCPGYIATGEGANYPTLQRVARAISASRSAKTSVQHGPTAAETEKAKI